MQGGADGQDPCKEPDEGKEGIEKQNILYKNYQHRSYRELKALYFANLKVESDAASVEKGDLGRSNVIKHLVMIE